MDWLSVEWNSWNAGAWQHVNIAATRTDRCAATSGLAYRHVAYLAAAFLGFLRCLPRRWSKTVTISPCWKIFSTVFATADITNALLAMVQPSLMERIIGPVMLQFWRPVLTWAVDGTASWIPKKGIRAHTGSPYQWTYAGGPSPGGKPVTILRIERRWGRCPESSSPEGRRAGRPANAGGSHRSAGSSESQRLTPFGAGHRPNQRTNQKRPQADSVSGARLFRHANRQSVWPPASRLVLLDLVGVSRYLGTVAEKNRLQLREYLGALNPGFAFAGFLTRGPVSRHATTSRLAEPVFGRRQVGAMSSETFDCPAGPGNTQVIAGHHFTPGDVYPQRTPAEAAGSARQRDIDNSNFFLPLGCLGDNSTAHIAYGDRLEYSCLDDDDAWSSVNGQYTDPTPQSVSVQLDEQCDTMSHSEQIILARTFVCDELPATDSLVPHTVLH